MKKWLIAAILVFILIVIAVAVMLIVKLPAIFQESKPTEPVQQTVQTQDVLAYAQEKWSDYQCSYDGAASTLTLKRVTALSYAEACSFGGSVYCDENAPQTYLDEVSMIALSAASDCNLPMLTVLLCYESTDGQVIFRVKSDGTIWTCWE